MAGTTFHFLQDGGECGRLIRAINWAETAMGPPESWAPELKAAVRAMLDSPLATTIYLGKEFLHIYNDAFIPTLGTTRHPKIMGKPMRETSQMWEVVGPHFLKVLQGEPVAIKDAVMALDKNGAREDCYIDISYIPLYNSAGEVAGVQCTLIETTEKVKAQLQLEQANIKLEESQRDLLSSFEDSPVGIAMIAAEGLVFRMVNKFYSLLTGRKPGDLVGKSLLEAIPELKGQGFEDLLQKVIDTKQPVEFKELPANIVRQGELETIYINFTYQPKTGADDKVSSILVVVMDVTDHVLSRKKIEESEDRLRNVIAAAPAGIGLFVGRDLIIENPNQTFIDIVGKGPGIEGLPLREAMPELLTEGQPFLNILDNVFTTGEAFISPASLVKIVQNGVLNDNYYNISYTPLRNAAGEIYAILDIAIDVTAQVKAQQQVEESEVRFRTMAEGTNIFVAVSNESGNAVYFNAAWTILTGKPMEALLEFGWADLIHPDDREQFVKIYLDAFKLRAPFTGECRVLTPGGNYRWLLANGTARFNPDGAFAGYISSSVDVTPQMEAKETIENKEKELRDLILAAPIGIAVVTGREAKFQEVNDRFVEISGKSPEQFVNATYWQVFPEVAEAFAPVLDNVFETGTKFTSEEAEMVLIRNGKPDRIFATFDYVPVFDSNNNVAKVIVLVIEVTHQVETRKRIEEAVHLRTGELNEANLNLKRSNAELEQFAYIASHDLQEPIRKISTFTQMLENSLEGKNEQAKNYFNKIYNSTDRMAKLIRDVLAFSQISQNQDAYDDADLSKILQSIQSDFELTIERTKATVITTDLPVIQAIPSQMVQLFSNLLSNSLKYTRKHVKPVIKITATVAKKEIVQIHPQLDSKRNYYSIQFSDNGIGFDQEHADRIFKIFQRLHVNSEFEGTGIGLSICRKIVQTHQGHISAAAGADGGAVFTILLPATV